jgi:hypothetical protein
MEGQEEKTLRILETMLPPVFPRSRVGQLTDGLFSPGYLANLDSAGTGPPRTAFGQRGQVVYERETFLDWVRKRSRPSAVAGRFRSGENHRKVRTP